MIIYNHVVKFAQRRIRPEIQFLFCEKCREESDYQSNACQISSLMIKDIGDKFQLKQWMLSLFLTMHFNLVTDPPQVRYSKLTETRLPLLIKQR